MGPKTLEHLKLRIAHLAVGSSTLRNQGAPRVVETVRAFLAQIDLRRLSVNSYEDFLSVLDDLTLELVKALPEGAKNWGAARKAINIFLRDCLYNRFLCDHFDLYHLHPWLEVPLDKLVAEGLRRSCFGRSLPRWPGVKNLDPPTSEKYQEVALKLAKKLRCNRVDLDLHLWRRQVTNELDELCEPSSDRGGLMTND